MTDVIPWIGMVWGTLTVLALLPVTQAERRLTTHVGLCAGCRARLQTYWTRKRAWFCSFGRVGPPLMTLTTATLWWSVPVLPKLADLAMGYFACLPVLPKCAGPSCAAHPRNTP
ncbi:hypothetical protein AB0I81_40320 [Nonomuraea sp. NPDC050404]|uniref:hypothetical protein n=1 Tax=Nonomuraea sp. NPDC050404 TaxID=3155783 RepID=UPI0033E00B40